MIRVRIKVFFSLIKQFDHQEGFVLNRLITDFQPRALRLIDCGRRHRARLKHESAWCFKVVFNRESWVLIGSNGIGVEERHPLRTSLAALRRIFNWLVRHINLLLFLMTHLTIVLIFVLLTSNRVCDNVSSSSTFSETFIKTHFVVKPTLRSNRPSKFKSSARYHKGLAILGKKAAFFEKMVDEVNIEICS